MARYCDPQAGTPIQILPGQDTVIDFAVETGGRLDITVVDLHSDRPIPSATVDLYFLDPPDPSPLRRTTDSQGRVAISGLDTTVTFHVTKQDHRPLLWDSLECPTVETTGTTCTLAQATPVSVPTGSMVAVTAPLEAYGGLFVRVSDGSGVSNWPMDGVDVAVYRPEEPKTPVAQGSTSSSGSIFFPRLEGTWTIAVGQTLTTHAAEMWDGFTGVICHPRLPPETGYRCAPALGGTITVPRGQHNVARFLLDHPPSDLITIGGRVTDDLGMPLEDVYIDLWDPLAGASPRSITFADGIWSFHLPPVYSFYVATANPHGLTDEIWDDVPCPEGPAAEGFCDPGPATEITFTEDRTDLDFVLESTLFTDGFESGDTTRWSHRVD